MWTFSPARVIFTRTFSPVSHLHVRFHFACALLRGDARQPCRTRFRVPRFVFAWAFLHRHARWPVLRSFQFSCAWVRFCMGVLAWTCSPAHVTLVSVAATRLTLTRLAESRLKRTVTPISQLVIPGNLTRPTRLKSRLVSRLMEG